jgi:hypothetical protein
LPRTLSEGLTRLGRVDAVQTDAALQLVDQDGQRIAVADLDDAAREVGERHARRGNQGDKNCDCPHASSVGSAQK